MLVTDITELSKTKARLYIDYQPAFALYKSELNKYGIKQGEELSERLYEMLVNEVLAKRAVLRAMNLLKSRDYTEQQLTNKLRQNEYPTEAIDNAISYVKKYGYIEDFRYSKAYISYAGATKSRKQIINDLLIKGVSKENIDKAFESCIEENNISDEEELIRKLLQKKHYDSAESTLQEKQKIVGFLYRKGFPLDKIYKVVGQDD